METCWLQEGGADRFRRSLHDTPATAAFTDIPCGVCPVRRQFWPVRLLRQTRLSCALRPSVDAGLRLMPSHITSWCLALRVIFMTRAHWPGASSVDKTQAKAR